MGKFVKGEPKRGGRKKGTPNKTTEQFRDMVKEFVQDNWDTLQEDFDKMKPGEKALLNPAILNVDQLKQVINYLQNEYQKRTT